MKVSQEDIGGEIIRDTEVYQVIDTEFLVRGGDIVLIPDGAFHQVFNTMTDEDLEFVCVFQSYTR